MQPAFRQAIMTQIKADQLAALSRRNKYGLGSPPEVVMACLQKRLLTLLQAKNQDLGLDLQVSMSLMYSIMSFQCLEVDASEVQNALDCKAAHICNFCSDMQTFAHDHTVAYTCGSCTYGVKQAALHLVSCCRKVKEHTFLSRETCCLTCRCCCLRWKVQMHGCWYALKCFLNVRVHCVMVCH